MSVPEPVRRVVEAWSHSGCPEQPGIRWPRENWRRWLAGFDPLLTSLPGTLDRAAVRAFGKVAHDSNDAAARAFVVTMVWGYGNVGYGPSRTAKILKNTPDAPERLVGVARALHTGTALDGYILLAADARLPGLGPSFGTKYLHFCSTGPAQERALVLDQNLADWLDRNTSLRLRPTAWSARTYRRYLDHMRGWAADLRRSPDDVEYCIFQDEVNRVGHSQWTREHGEEMR